MQEFKPINLRGYEGGFECPNCGMPIRITQGNSDGKESIFTCIERHNSGCGKEYKAFVKELK